MEIKKCPICQSELPLEANFCPYCMTKLMSEEGTELQIPDKTRNKKLHKIIKVECIIMAILCVSIIAILLKTHLWNSKNDTYADYLGIWYDDEHKNADHITETGGRVIEVCKVYNDEIVINIESISSTTLTNPAQLEYIHIKLTDGEGNFSFSDDGFGNRGTGRIKLADGRIYAKIDLASLEYGGEWDLSMDTYFTQVQKFAPGQKMDIYGLINNFYAQKCMLGERTDIEELHNKMECFYEKGIYVTMTETNVLDDVNALSVKEIVLDYDRINSNYSYCYKGIDNTCNKEQVKKILGKENIEDNDYVFVYRDEDEMTVNYFYFGDDGYVESINCVSTI